MTESIMSDGSDGPDAMEKAGIGATLNRCRALAAKIGNELRNKRPEHFIDKLSLADSPLAFREPPESLSERDRRLHVLDPLFRQLPPLTANRAVENRADQFWPVILFHLTAESSGQSGFVAVHHLFKHPGRRHARQIGPAGR